jgi:excisionase family DNA binding protein
VTAKGDGAPDALDLRGRLALRPREAADALGVSLRTLRRMLHELPHVRRAGAVLIPVDGLRRWLEAQAEAEEGRVEAAVRDALRKVSPTP